MMYRLILFILSMGIASAAVAQSATPVVSDSRIKTFVYNESDVYSILTHYGYQSNIEFGKHEQVSTVSVGDRVAWQIVPAGNRLFIKAMEENAHTNMTVVTNKRAYQFDLRSTGQIPNYPSQELVYVVRFFYPDENPLGAQPPIYSDTMPSAMPDMAAYSQAVPVAPVAAMSNMPGAVAPGQPYPPSPYVPQQVYAAQSYPPAMTPAPNAAASMNYAPNGLPPLNNLVEDQSVLPGYNPKQPSLAPASVTQPSYSVAQQPPSQQPPVQPMAVYQPAPATPAAPDPSLAMAAYPTQPPAGAAPSPAPAAPPAASSAPVDNKVQSGQPNYNYTFSGPEQSAPIKIYDDGKATYFTFQPGGKARPKFYKLDAKGKETPVAAVLNQSGELVVSGLSPRFTIRNNGASITVFNENALSKQTM